MIKRAASIVVMGLLASSCAFVSVGSCSGTEIIGEFKEVGDLVQAANVQSADVEIGQVTDIKLDKQNWVARVTMCIAEDEKIPRDVHASVRQTSLLGEIFIDLQPRSSGEPFLSDGDVISVEDTSKAAQLEDVFTKLGAVLGAGNLEQINRFTSAQAKILSNHADDLKVVLSDLHQFTGIVAERRHELGRAIDELDATASRLLDDSQVIETFLDSFAEGSRVLSDQKESLESLLVSLDRFTQVSVRLLDVTEDGLNKQFSDLRPVLRTLVTSSEDIRATLKTLATFSEWFPESMPGDYLQLDVCQAPEGYYGQGKTCPQAIGNDDPEAPSGSGEAIPDNAIQLIFERTLRGGRR